MKVFRKINIYELTGERKRRGRKKREREGEKLENDLQLSPL
jgi:hypothetical protein